MAIKDFSKADGLRLRIPLTVYDRQTGSFRHVPETAALVTVADEAEQKRLWESIEKAIAGGKWRNGRTDSGGDRPRRAEARI